MIESGSEQKVFWGDGDLPAHLASALSELGAKRVFVVCGRNSFSASGVADVVKAGLAGREWERFSDFSSNPKIEDLNAGLKKLRAFRADVVLAAGGGSILDMGKLLAFFSALSRSPEEYLDAPDALSPDGEPLPTIAVPTTAGTGSEATHFAVLYRNGEKRSVADSSMLPAYVLLNPEFTRSLSPYQTACTGFDALAQGIESLWAKGATDESAGYAKKAVRLALESLESAVKNGDRASREKMMEAAYWAGRAINISKTTVCHALSYYMTSRYGYPHGHAVALFLPAVFAEHERRGAVPEALNRLFPADAPPASTLRELVNRLGLVPDRTFSSSETKTIAGKTNPQRLRNNPVDLPAPSLEGMVENALSGA